MSDAEQFVSQFWEEEILPALFAYIKIPNKSPLFDPDWQSHGYMDQAVELAADWCRKHAPEGADIRVERLEGRTPLLLVDVPGDSDRQILIYGHLDKQPEFEGWRDGLGPWLPVRDGDRLYGRGGADDGYAVFAAIAALRLLARQGKSHARCTILIECSEESGSKDLPHYMDHLSNEINDPDLLICLDTECVNFEQLWSTTSVRGSVIGNLKVNILNEGVHSGAALGIVPSSLRVLRSLLDRVEDSRTGKILLDTADVEIPDDRSAEARQAADLFCAQLGEKFPFADGVDPAEGDPTSLILNNTWKPFLEITGANGLPAIGQAGNVLRPSTEVKIALRIPPTAKSNDVSAQLKHLFESNPPYGAQVTFTPTAVKNGWNAPETAPWLDAALEEASQQVFGKPHMKIGCGGGIPFLDFLKEIFPKTQYFVTGVLGPNTNAHGPNEFLHIEMAKRLTRCVASVIHSHFTERANGQ